MWEDLKDWLFGDDDDLYGDIADAYDRGDLDEDEAIALADEYFPIDED